MKFLFLIPAILFSTFSAPAQNVKYISLKQEKITYAPKGFYISDVVDDREDKTSIGVINARGDKENIDMQNGVAASLKTFIEHNVKQDRSAQPVTLHITKLDADAKKSGGEWNVLASVDFSFYAGDTRVVDLTGNGHAQMSSDPGDYYEGFIRKTIDNDLKRFEEWWSQNKGRVITSSSVKVNVAIGKTTDKPDCIVYSLDRPLQIADFQGPVQGQEFEMAVTASGIGVSYTDETTNGQLVIDLVITPYFSRAKSWFKKEGRSSNVLAHEQTHFDIAAIKACELANQIRKTSFTQENYKQLLEQMQQQNGQESNDEEMVYDNETNHGIITDKQQAWQNKITEQVKTIGCY